MAAILSIGIWMHLSDFGRWAETIGSHVITALSDLGELRRHAWEPEAGLVRRAERGWIKKLHPCIYKAPELVQTQ